MKSALRAETRPRDVWAWAMYDFANSGYTTVVVTALFNAYFVAVVAGGAPWATLAWTGALAVSYLAILGPFSYGLVTWATDGDHRRAFWTTGLFFLVGLALLGGVRAGRGRRAALRVERFFAKESL